MFRRDFCRRLDHLVEQLLEAFQTGRRNDYGVATATYIFRDPQEATARILLERELKRFALDMDRLSAKCVLGDRRLGRVINFVMAVRRRSFVRDHSFTISKALLLVTISTAYSAKFDA